jgi:DNA repair protein RecO (recombination protein O)
VTNGGGAPAARSARTARATLRVPAIVLRRSDFRESSRIVTCLSREHGRLTGLAKGAHRPDSPFLGRLDFLNEVNATFSADRGGLRLLERADLVRERRALREPLRFLAASHLAQLSEFALPEDRADPAVFDLLQGGLNLIERCPPAAIGHIVLGLELRHLQVIGAMPDLDHCTQCGMPLQAAAFRHDETPGLMCRDHASLPLQPIRAEVLALLRLLLGTPGRLWPELVPPVAARTAAHLPAHWLAVATEQRPRLRPLLFARC